MRAQEQLCSEALIFAYSFAMISHPALSVAPLFNIRDYGATGNGSTMDTLAIQDAIDAASSIGGGTVVFPPGTYRSAPIQLSSGVRLHLEKDAVLLASSDPADYPDWIGKKFISEKAVYNARYFIGAEGASDISISGAGTIDGCGNAFYDDSGPVDGWAKIRNKSERPARLLFLADCQNVLIQGISLVNAPAWTVWAVGCDRVRFEGLRIETNYRYINTDGLDIDGCRDVVVAHCRIRTGDDAIVFRAITSVFPDYRPCEQIRVENCVLSSNCNAVRFAYLNDGDIRNIVLENLTITESRRGIICQIPTLEETPERGIKQLQAIDLPGPEVENIRCSNIRISAQRPLWFRVSAGARARNIGNIRLENIEISGCTPSLLEGSKNFRFANLVLENIHYRIVDGPLLLNTPETTPRAAAFIATHCDHLTLRNFTVAGSNDSISVETPVLYFEGITGLHTAEIHNRSSYLCVESDCYASLE